MIVYLLKAFACSALFLAFYSLVLEKEKMLRFNRAYLLISLLLSYIIPFIRLTTASHWPAVIEGPSPDTLLYPIQPVLSQPIPARFNLWPVIAAGAYLLITFLFLARFFIHILNLLRLSRTHPGIAYGPARLILLPEKGPPYSFLRYIFLNKRDYQQNSIPLEIMQHELEHVKQKHSLDIILIESAIAFLWINPVLFLYRRSIRLNHEFLADSAAARLAMSPAAYQSLLLKITAQSAGIPLSSYFNYSITKKRLNMITKQTSLRRTVVRMSSALSTAGLAFFLFSTHVSAQRSSDKEMPETNHPAVVDTLPADTLSASSLMTPRMVGGTEAGISNELMNEYQDLVIQFLDPRHNRYQNIFTMPAETRKRLENIFRQMSPQQQKAQLLLFMEPLKPLAMRIPSAGEMAAFKNSRMYEIWIDYRKVDNATLAAYKNTEFGWFSVSRLSGMAKKGKSYQYQVDLITLDVLNRENETKKANRESLMTVALRRL